MVGGTHDVFKSGGGRGEGKSVNVGSALLLWGHSTLCLVNPVARVDVPVAEKQKQS